MDTETTEHNRQNSSVNWLVVNMFLGSAIGIGIGFIVGVKIQNITDGIGIGLILGVCLGLTIEMLMDVSGSRKK